MDLRGIFVGAALGSLAAWGVWSLAGPTPSPSDAPALGSGEVVVAKEPAPRATATETASEAQTTESAARVSIDSQPPDPDFAVIAFGRIVDREGRVVSGATPVFEDAEARTREASSGPEGGWSLHGLAPGEWELSANVTGFLPHREVVVVPAARHWRHDFTLERARSLPVRFETPTGEAIAARRFGDDRAFLGVCATTARPTSPLPGVHGRVIYAYGEGVFRSRSAGGTPPDLDPRYQGVLELKSSPPLWISVTYRDAVLESRPLALEEEELVFVISDEDLEQQHGELRVRVVERGTGTPIEKGIELTHPSGGIRIQSECDQGTWTFSDVPTGTMDLMFQHGEWERLERSVRVPAGGSLDLGTIVLGRREPFEVLVEDEDGNPLPVRVAAARPELAGSPGDMDMRISTSANAEGVSSIPWLAPGPTLVRAGGRDGWGRVAKLVDTGTVKEVKLVLPRGTQVIFRRGAAHGAGSEFLLEDASGLQLREGSYLPGGMFLAPGRYTLRVLASGVEVERVPFEVSEERIVVRCGGA